MKKLIAFLCILSLQVTPAMALVGGPWSGNTHDGNTGGVFSGSMHFRNGSGIFRFSNNSAAQISVQSVSVIYYKGRTYLGSCMADIDFGRKKVTGITNGSSYNRSPSAATNQSPPLIDNNPDYAPGRPQTAPFSGVNPLAIDPFTGAIVPFTYSNSLNSASSALANSFWEGNITTNFPNIRFKAKGEVAFIGSAPSVYRGSGSLTGDATSAQTTSIIDFGGNDPIEDPENREKVRVFGNRSSYALVGATSPETTGVGTGGGGFAF
jgi:hypothetical protein